MYYHDNTYFKIKYTCPFVLENIEKNRKNRKN